MGIIEFRCNLCGEFKIEKNYGVNGRKICDKCKQFLKNKEEEPIKKICNSCKKEFFVLNMQRKYCDDCKESYHISVSENFDNLNTGTIGTIQELRVNIDLLKKGFEVFKALSPMCSCDLLVQKEKKIFSVEVKSVSKRSSPGHKYFARKIRANCLAIVFKDKILYNPDVEEIIKNDTKP